MARYSIRNGEARRALAQKRDDAIHANANARDARCARGARPSPARALLARFEGMARARATCVALSAKDVAGE